MNQITSALVSAGVKIPSVSKRIWNYIKDHPGVSAKRVSQALAIQESQSSALMSQMYTSGVLSRQRVVMRLGVSGGVRNVSVWHYRVEGSEYGETRRSLRSVRPESIVTLPAVKTEPAAPVKKTGPGVDIGSAHSERPSAQQQINALTVAQARELWLILNRMFGEQK
jgi:hypothetical protein